jgi:hypothetical protein
VGVEILLQVIVAFGLKAFNLEPITNVDFGRWQGSGMHPTVHESRSTIVSLLVGWFTLRELRK